MTDNPGKPAPYELMRAVKNKNAKAVEEFLQSGVDFNDEDVCWEVLLHAARHKYTEIARLLIDNGADLDRRGGNFGLTPLMETLERNCPEIARLLIAGGAKIDATDNMGWTALMYAAKYNRVEIVRLLLDKGADLGMQDKGGYTAADWGQPEAAQLLKEEPELRRRRAEVEAAKVAHTTARERQQRLKARAPKPTALRRARP